LSERLRARRREIEQAMLTRISAISEPGETEDPTYTDGLRAAVAAALDHGLRGIEAGDGHPPPIPPPLIAQARLAALNGVSLGTVLRRYFAGYSLLANFLVEEAEEECLDPIALRGVLRSQANLFDRLLEAVGEEYALETQRRPSNSEQRRAEQVKRLLDGELLDTSELIWDFDSFHLGAVAEGPGAAEALRHLASSEDHRLLLVRHKRGTIWAWLGNRHRPDPAEVAESLQDSHLPNCSVALGEPAQGLPGWRLSHRQALSALPVALRGPEPVVCYAEVALIAGVLKDDLLATSLRQIYLEPLQAERDGGKVARQTLRAYLAAERNVSSTAAALGVYRGTVATRLRAIEERLGCSLDSCAADLEMALRLEELSHQNRGPAAM
jgi:PucR C-terminal helix-turn-helix domain/GGDEF-like domain